MQVNMNQTECIESNDDDNDRLAEEILKPAEEKMISTNWILRKSAFSEIIDEIRHLSENNKTEDTSKLIDEYLSKIQLSYDKIVEDPNPNSLEAGLDLIITILKNQSNISAEKKNHIFTITIEKAYACSKTATKEKSRDILITILQQSHDTGTQFELLKKILEYPVKKIKLIMFAEQILLFLISEYGAQTIDFKFFMPVLVQLIQYTNHGIKYEALEVVKEIYRQVKSDVIPYLREVKENVLKEIRNNFDKIDDIDPERKIVDRPLVPKEPVEEIEAVKEDAPVIQLKNESEDNTPALYLNNEIAQSNSNQGNVNHTVSNVATDGKRDMYLHELYNDDILECLLSKEKKWMDKKEILDELTKNINSNKIVYTGSLADFEKFFFSCRQMLKDTNINIVQSTLNMINSLSIQFGKPFGIYAKEYFPWILEKFKEKKEKLNKEIITTLSSFLKYNLSLDEIVPILCDVASDSSIPYKLNISEFLLITLRKTYKNILQMASVDLIELFDKLSDEQNVEIRQTSLNCLALIKVRLSDSVKNEGLMDDLTSNKLTVIEELTKMINYDKSYDVEFQGNKIESPPAKVMRRSNEPNSEFSDLTKSSRVKVEKNEIQEKIVEPKVKIDKRKEQVVEVENRSDKLNNMNEGINSAKIPKSKTSVVEPPLVVKNEIENDPSEIPISQKKTQQQSDLEEFERKLEEAMKKESERGNDEGPPQRKPPVKKPVVAVNKKPVAVASPVDNPNPSNSQKANDDDEENSKMNKEEVEEKINSFLGSEAATLLSSPKWDEKKNGFIMLNEWITENTNSNYGLIQSNVENLVIFMKLKLKDYKEVNFNLVREAITIYTNLISNFSGKGFDKKFTLAILKGLAEKIADVKLKDNMSNLLIAMMENQGPKFIQSNILKIIEKKAPSNNALKEYSAFFEKAIDDFGIGLTPVKEMVELCKGMAANTNPQVRNSSTSLLCVLYKYVGKDIRTLLKDIKESTLKVIEAEFDKITVLDVSAINALPKRQLKAAALKEEGLVNTATTSKNSSKNPAMNIMDSLIPRQDISKKITAKIMKDINDGKWQEKKEAADALEKILTDANLKILPTGLNDLFGVFKGRLSDGNKNVVRLVVSLLTKLIDCIGSPFKTFTKPLAVPLLNNLSDKAQLLREDVVVCMDKWVAHCGLDTIIIYIPPLLHKQDNFEMRTELLKFLHKYKESFVFIKDKFEMKEFVPSMLSCLQDKTTSIRNSADDLTAYLLRFVPLTDFINGLKDYKTAIANTLRILLEKYKGVNMGDAIEQNAGNTSLTLNTKYNRSGEIKKDLSENSLTPKKNKKEEDKNKIKSKAESTGNVNSNSNSNQAANLNENKPGKNMKGNETVNNTIPNNKDKIVKKNNNDENPKVNPGIMSPNNGKKNTQNINANNSNNIFNSGMGAKNGKEKRLEIDKKYKFNLDTINEDFEIKLKDQLRQVLSTDILEKLFHQDLKQNIDAIQILSTILKENALLTSSLYDNLDLILKWIGWKSYNNQNPLLIKLVIDFCDKLIEKIGENELNLNETEGYILVAVLVDKLSNSNSKLKEISKILLEKSLNYISAKISTLVSSSAGKNSKVKMECIDMCTDLVSNMGPSIAPHKDIRAIAKMLNTNDNNLKLSIVKFLGEIYSAIKDNLWSILNDLPDKTKELLYSKFNQMGLVPVEGSNDDSEADLNQDSLEEEYKPYANKVSVDSSYRDISAKSTGNVSQSSMVSNYNNNLNNSSFVNQNNIYNNNYVNQSNMHLLKNSDSITKMPSKIKPDFNDDRLSQSVILSNQKINSSNNHANFGMSPGFVVENITDRNELIQILNNLNSGEVSERVNTILIIHELIFTRFNQTKHILIPNIDIIIKSFILALKILFQNKNLFDIPLKLGKYLLTVLYKISSNKDLIKNVSYMVLFELSEEVLTNLLIENLDKVGENQEGLIIVRSLNSTMLRILENCNYTEVITILLELVKRYRSHEFKSKISGLAIKCLLKINQVIKYHFNI